MPKSPTAMPKEGQKAPAFQLPASSGKTVKLADFKGNPVVLYFYPRDDTPGCTVEAKGFQAHRKQFEELGAAVVGVSPDSADSHCKFAGKHNLSFTLLSDEAHTVAERYGVWVEKNMYGKKRMGIQRATFLIDGAGKLARVWPKVKPDGHAQEVLDALKEL
jgi:peroxiredoxin Q/BCP